MYELTSLYRWMLWSWPLSRNTVSLPPSSHCTLTERKGCCHASSWHDQNVRGDLTVAEKFILDGDKSWLEYTKWSEQYGTFESDSLLTLGQTFYMLEFSLLFMFLGMCRNATHSVWYSWKGVNCSSRFRQLSVQSDTLTSARETARKMTTVSICTHAR